MFAKLNEKHADGDPAGHNGFMQVYVECIDVLLVCSEVEWFTFSHIFLLAVIGKKMIRDVSRAKMSFCSREIDNRTRLTTCARRQKTAAKLCVR